MSRVERLEDQVNKINVALAVLEERVAHLKEMLEKAYPRRTGPPIFPSQSSLPLPKPPEPGPGPGQDKDHEPDD